MWKCAGFFQPAKASGKANGKKKRSEEDRTPLSAAYKAVLEAQIVEGTEVGRLDVLLTLFFHFLP